MPEATHIVILAVWYATYLACLGGALALGRHSKSRDDPANQQGASGEQRVAQTLSQAGYRVLTDLTIQNGNRTHQIDHTVAGRDRLFVLETKTWRGTIEGRAGGQTWTLRRPKSRSTLSVYNPLRQNQTHAEVIDAITHVPITPLIVTAGSLTASPELAPMICSVAGLPAVLGSPGPLSARIERAFHDLEQTKAAWNQTTLARRHINSMKNDRRFHPARVLWFASALSLACALLTAERIFAS